LYVVLVALAPFLLWLLQRRRTLVLLALSWAVYIFHAIHPVRVLPTQSENSFPILAWQLLFVHGIVAGYHRQQIVAAFRSRLAPPLGALVVGLSMAMCLFALSNPWRDVPGSAWLCIPIGQASLYIFVIHLVFVLAASNIGVFQQNLIGLNTAFHTMTILIIWLMVRRRVFFHFIPR
jgi:hypothetical protein